MRRLRTGAAYSRRHRFRNRRSRARTELRSTRCSTKINERCKAAISRPLTVVTGPPGTGKSLVVAHVLSNVALRGGAALFASRNHQALEAVEPRLNAMAEHQPIMLRPTRPFGQNAEQFDWFRMMTDLLAKPRVPGASERLARARGAVGRLLAGRSASERDMRRLAELRVRLAAIQEEIRQCSARCPARWRDHARGNHALADLLKPELIRGMVARAAALGETARGLRAGVWRWITVPLSIRRLRTQMARLASDPGLAVLRIDSRDDRGFLTSPDGAPRVLADLLAIHDLIQAYRSERSVRTQIENLPAPNDLNDQLAVLNDRLRGIH